jgi:steroid 5-alpha reductase family enzyme
MKPENKKYIVRRAVVGIIAAPIVAAVYTLSYSLLVGLGAQPTSTVDGVWANGFLIGGVIALFFTFANQVKTVVNRIVGE